MTWSALPVGHRARAAFGRSALRVAVALALASGCSGQVETRDQWTIWLATDMPVPNGVDRALVEILDGAGNPACTDCRRLVGVPTKSEGWPISFGVVVPPSGLAPRVRVRLYAASRVGQDGEPRAPTTIDRVVKLPPPKGNTEVPLVLHAECVGLPADLAAGLSCAGPTRQLEAEVELSPGRPDPAMRPGAWARSVSAPCTIATSEAEVCVPGGLFVLGDPNAISTTRLVTTPERFVTLSPFALDREEMTVGTVRGLVESRRLKEAPTKRVSDAFDPMSHCTYLGVASSANDALPINCIAHALAEDVCALLGKRLPTEAEWEWAAGNLEEETSYPWGEGDPCTHADVGLGAVAMYGSSQCLALPGRSTSRSGVPKRGNPRDRTRLGLLAMGGGVSEWVADWAERYDDPCWNPDEPFLLNPRCSSGANHIIRGSSWGDAPGLVTVSKRQAAPPTNVLPIVGFRCARSE